MSTQPEPLRLADALRDGTYLLSQERSATEAALRHLQAEFERLERYAKYMDETLAAYKEVSAKDAANLEVLVDAWNKRNAKEAAADLPAEVDRLRAQSKGFETRLDGMTERAREAGWPVDFPEDVPALMQLEIERLRALTMCGCGDQFTAHDPGTCGACVAGADKTAELERLRTALQEADTLMGHEDQYTEWRERWAHLWQAAPTEPKP